MGQDLIPLELRPGDAHVDEQAWTAAQRGGRRPLGLALKRTF